MKWLKRLLCRVRGHRWNGWSIFSDPARVWCARDCTRCDAVQATVLLESQHVDPEPWKVPAHGQN